jgi:hypothetical protein
LRVGKENFQLGWSEEESMMNNDSDLHCSLHQETREEIEKKVKNNVFSLRQNCNFIQASLNIFHKNDIIIIFVPDISLGSHLS